MVQSGGVRVVAERSYRTMGAYDVWQLTSDGGGTPLVAVAVAVAVAAVEDAAAAEVAVAEAAFVVATVGAS